MNNQNNCTNNREAIAALVLGVLERENVERLRRHLETCQNCKSFYQSMRNEEKDIRSSFNEIVQKGEVIQSFLIEKLDNNKLDNISAPKAIKIWSLITGSPLIKFAAAILLISSLVACFVLSGKNADLKYELDQARQDITPAPIDDSVTISFYLKEHQDFIARQASLNSAASQSIEMQINQNDILYYEPFGSQPDFMNPGIIVRRPPYQDEISSSETPAISNGHELTLSEARTATDFDFVSLSLLSSGYVLDQIRKIEGRDSLQLLYTDGINSVSLFEQPLDGQRGLSHQDFREYAVYNNPGESGGTILAWRDDTLSYVLISNTEISQLMDMAQSINAGK